MIKKDCKRNSAEHLFPYAEISNEVTRTTTTAAKCAIGEAK